MGPRQWCRGRQLAPGASSPRTGSFNGATTKVSWKALTDLAGSRGLQSLQWGHDNGVVEGNVNFLNIAGGASFNGATTRCRGRRPSLTATRYPSRCFNGATTKVSWKASSSSEHMASTPELQWGHDKGVVEGAEPDVRKRPDVVASMGPRQRCRGRLFVPPAGTISVLRCFNGATTKVSWKALIKLANSRLDP